MYKKIMVPLDGSKLAECVLPHAEALAKWGRVQTIMFVRVVEPVKQPNVGEYVLSEQEIAKINAEQKAAAEKYLEQLKDLIHLGSIQTRWEVLMGKVDETLVDYANKNAVDLIIIATHGRSGVSRWIWGSVADRVLRSACVPVLMIRGPGCVPGV
jgi:nucleotide-binding universal stress UspA family protein